MKVGDIAIKKSGHHAGKIGLVLSVKTNSRRCTLVSVLCEGIARRWNANYVEVIYESR